MKNSNSGNNNNNNDNDNNNKHTCFRTRAVTPPGPPKAGEANAAAPLPGSDESLRASRKDPGVGSAGHAKGFPIALATLSDRVEGVASVVPTLPLRIVVAVVAAAEVGVKEGDATEVCAARCLLSLLPGEATAHPCNWLVVVVAAAVVVVVVAEVAVVPET